MFSKYPGSWMPCPGKISLDLTSMKDHNHPLGLVEARNHMDLKSICHVFNNEYINILYSSTIEIQQKENSLADYLRFTLSNKHPRVPQKGDGSLSDVEWHMRSQGHVREMLLDSLITVPSWPVTWQHPTSSHSTSLLSPNLILFLSFCIYLWILVQGISRCQEICQWTHVKPEMN